MERTEEYDYHLPHDLIAQYPSDIRGNERLLILHRTKQTINHGAFEDIASLLKPGDVLVLNDSKVIHARILGTKSTGGKIEVFLVRKIDTHRWACMLRMRRGAKIGLVANLPGGKSAEIIGKGQHGLWELQFRGFESGTSIPEQLGEIPLPPYIDRSPEALDIERYQTVFAGPEGSVAAPTAGLHFTEPLLQRLKEKGVEICALTLHVGPGTFQPIRTDLIADHRLDPEFFSIPTISAQCINEACEENRRIIAVGTTVTRALEFVTTRHGKIVPTTGWTDLLIHPPYSFKVVTSLITNFHLPRSSLLALVVAMAGRDLLQKAYQEAIRLNYRFYSYGDAMFVV